MHKWDNRDNEHICHHIKYKIIVSNPIVRLKREKKCLLTEWDLNKNIKDAIDLIARPLKFDSPVQRDV